MMAGAWITAAARRVLHDDTFQLTVSPAIADLQFEAPDASAVDRLRGYLGVWSAFWRACCRDLAGDVWEIADDAPALTSLVLLQACYYASLLALMSGLASSQYPARAVMLEVGYVFLLGALILALATVPTLVCFWPPRRSGDPAGSQG